MFIIENYGFFIFLVVIILIIFYFSNNQCFDLRKNIQEGFKTMNENFSNPEKINIANVNYLDSCNRMKDYYELQKAKSSFEEDIDALIYHPDALSEIEALIKSNCQR